ncbi:MAG: PorT family protein [Sinomicrobium sp.]|nr:PorT family protein [Sinomicrobium sp.]
MSDRKNIDRLFREKFRYFEAVPDAHVWSAIEKQLGKGKKDRRIFPFILRYGGIAAAMALLITLGYNLNPDRNLVDPQKITTIDTKENNAGNVAADVNGNIPENKDNAVSNNTTYIGNRPIPVKNTRISGDEHAPEKLALNDPETHAATQNDIAQNNPTKENTTATAHTPVTTENSDAVAGNGKSLFDAIRENNTVEGEAVVQNAEDKWSVTPNAAPIYFNSLGEGSPINEEFRDNSKSGNITLSYGINVAYQVNNRLSVRSGINRVSYGYNTNNIEYTPAGRNDTGDIIVKVSDASTADVNNPPTAVVMDKPLTREGKMVQEFGYLEVPLEVKYRLLNKKIGVNIIGGLSSLFLTDNKVSVKDDSFNTPIAQPQNLNEFNLSTNVGLGIDYKVSNEILLNVEPMFKYQLNTFSSDSGGFKPYSLGVYTGLSFRF